MFLEKEHPTKIHALISAFLGTIALADFSREQTAFGAEAALTLSMANRIEGDFAEAFSGLPRNSNGKEVDLTPYAAHASTLAKQLLAMLEAQARPEDETGKRSKQD